MGIRNIIDAIKSKKTDETGIIGEKFNFLLNEGYSAEIFKTNLECGVQFSNGTNTINVVCDIRSEQVSVSITNSSGFYLNLLMAELNDENHRRRLRNMELILSDKVFAGGYINKDEFCEQVEEYARYVKRNIEKIKTIC